MGVSFFEIVGAVEGFSAAIGNTLFVYHHSDITNKDVSTMDAAFFLHANTSSEGHRGGVSDFGHSVSFCARLVKGFLEELVKGARALVQAMGGSPRAR
jgi:hypothetical protein